MKRLVAVLSLTPAVLFCLGLQVAAAAGDGKIYATMSGDAGTAVIDPMSLDAWGNIKSGNSSSRLETTLDNTFVYISVLGENKVKRIDVSTDAVVGEVKTGESPYSMDLTPDGRLLLVCNDAGNSLSVIDTASFKEAKRVKLDGAPEAIKISPDGKYAYVAVGDPSAVLTVLDMKSLLPVSKLKLPDQVYDLEISPTGDRLYVNSVGARKILIVDTANLKVVDSIDSNEYFGLALSKDGKEIWFFGPDRNLTASSTEKKKAVTLPFSERRCGGQRINLSPDGKLLFAWPAGEECDTINIYDTALKKKTGEIKLPQTPTWVTYIQK